MNPKKKESRDRQAQNLKAALAAARAGCPVFPCNPGTKSPYVKWKSDASVEPKQIHHLWNRYPDAIPGLVTGDASGLAVVDLDVKNGKDGIREFKRLGLGQGCAGATVRTPTGGIHHYFEHREGVRNSQDKYARGIDVRGEGGYVIAPGSLSEVGTYDLISGDLELVRILSSQLPELFHPHKKASRETNWDVEPLDAKKVCDALTYIPNDQNYDAWMRIIMACKHGYAGSEEGLQTVQEWCAGYPGYDPSEVEKMWASIDENRAGGITVGTLFLEAQKRGWRGNIDDAFDDDSDDEDQKEECSENRALMPVSGKKVVHENIQELNKRFALVRMGSKVVIADLKRNGDIDFLGTGSFRELFANRKHGKKTLGSAWIMHPARRTYEGGLVFKPDGDVPSDTLNLWTGWDTKADPAADCSLIIQHITEVVADGNDEHANYIFSWLADIVQNPGKKPGVALVLKGKKGVGKDTVAEIMKMIIGRRHCAHVPATERLTGRFNSAFATAVLIHVEEAIWGGQRESKGVVQSLITSPEMPLERKNVDTVQIDSFCRLLFTTNESWAIPATADERRYAVFEVSDARRGNRAYFDALYDQIEHTGANGFLAFLENWQTPKGIELRNPPQTKGLMEQKLSNLRGVERWWYEILCDGEVPYSDNEIREEPWEQSGLTVRREDLRRAYEQWMHQRRYQGEIVGPSEFGASVKFLCADVSSNRPTEDGARIWKYRFPPLTDCRAAFLRAMGGSEEEITWSV